MVAPLNYKTTQVEMDYLELQEDGSDSWRAAGVLETLREGGVGVIPTDTSYSFVARVDDKRAVQRLLALKGSEDEKKPLSLLCADLGTIDESLVPRPSRASPRRETARRRRT